MQTGAGISPFLVTSRGSAERQANVADFAAELRSADVAVTAIDAVPLSHGAVNGQIGATGDTVMTPPLMSFLRGCFGGGTYFDVPLTHLFSEDVEWAAAEGIVEGFDDGTFRPSATVTRQAWAAFLHRLSGDEPVVLPATPSFSDVSAGHPFAEDVEWAASAGVVRGYDDGTFRPGAVVTRQAAVAFLHRTDPLLP